MRRRRSAVSIRERKKPMPKVKIIGAGLAGSEAAYQLISKGIEVELYEMRPKKSTPAHKTANFSELVCSNSLRSNALTNGVGLLKEEMRRFGSLIMDAAEKYQIPAGSALAVDREGFSSYITEVIKSSPLVTVIEEEVDHIPEGPTIIASGPLSSEKMCEALQDYFHKDFFHFFDAIAPIVYKDSIDFSKAYYKSRYGVGEDDYINCPMTRDEFFSFYQELINAKMIDLHEFEQVFFEGCMPIEEMARRGMKTMLFGPLKPVGLSDDTHHPYAVVQLRQDNARDSLYNIVGFQTHLTYGEQKRVFSMIPGLEHAEFARYGEMHRNTYINSPSLLKATYQDKSRNDLFFAGQLTGVEGYIESAASGMLAGINMALYLKGETPLVLPDTCMMGAMANYITHASKDSFAPMNANFGIMRLLQDCPKNMRKEFLSRQALEVIQPYIDLWKNI